MGRTTSTRILLLALAACSGSDTGKPSDGTHTVETADTVVLSGDTSPDTAEPPDTGTGDTGTKPVQLLAGPRWVARVDDVIGPGISVGPADDDGVDELLVSVLGPTPPVYNYNGLWAGAALLDGPPLPSSGELYSQATQVWDIGALEGYGLGVHLTQDVTGDGAPDALIGTDEADVSWGQTLSVYTSGPTGITPTSLAARIRNASYGWGIGDADGDGHRDVEVNGARLLFGPLQVDSDAELDWSFRVSDIDLSSSVTFGARASADFTGDGRTDVVWHHNDTDERALLFADLQAGERTIADADATWFADPASTAGVRIRHGGADLDGDGTPDLVLGSNDGDSMNAYLFTTTTGGPVDQAFATLEAAVATTVWAATAGDFDDDGHDDLAVSTDCDPNLLLVFRGPLQAGTLAQQDADAAFTPSLQGDPSCFSAPRIQTLDAGDLDGDGRDDIAMGLFDEIRVLSGGGL